MKKTLFLLLTAASLVSPLVAQQVRHQLQPGQAAEPAPSLPTFDLDFAGGTPDELVDLLQSKLDVFNAIVPEEHKEVHLPPLKMRRVNVSQLFQALGEASRKRQPSYAGYQSPGMPVNHFQETTISTGFRTLSSPITPESVWYFYVDKPQEIPLPRNVQFFQLKGFLETYKIDDITTAIQAGWKMLGQNEQVEPQLNYHEETKLLIASGSALQLETIRSVLSELAKGYPREVRENRAAAPGVAIPAQPAPQTAR